MWFLAAKKLGRITMSGATSFVPVDTVDTGSVNAIVTGPDGALWFTERAYDAIGRYGLPSSASVTFAGRPIAP